MPGPPGPCAERLPEHTFQVMPKPSHTKPHRPANIGRPTTYEDAFCQRVVDCGDVGFSFAQIARDLGVARSMIYKWADRHSAFRDALVQARDASLAWWERQGQKGLWAGKEFNDRVLKFIMTNQFRDDYKERVEVSGALAKIDFGRMTDEQLAQIADGQHPYEVLAPKREVLVAGTAEVVEEVTAEVVEEGPPPGESEGD